MIPLLLLLNYVLPLGPRAFASHSKTVGFVWLESSSKVSVSEKRKVMRELKANIENNWGARLIVWNPKNVMTREALENHKKRHAILNLVERAIQENDSKAQEMMQKQIQQEVQYLSKSMFGPELQKAKLAQAFLLWKQKNIKKARQLVGEAQALHPSGELFIPNWEFHPAAHVFESVLEQWQKDHRNKVLCRLEGAFEKNYKVWVNGFSLDSLAKGFQKGLYLVQVKNEKDQLFEKIFYCTGQNFVWGRQSVLSPVNHYRLEQMATSDLLLTDAVIVGQWKAQAQPTLWLLEENGLQRFELDSLPHALNFTPSPVNVLSSPTAFQAAQEGKWYNKSSIWWGLVGGMVAAGVGYLVINQVLSAAPFPEARIVLKGNF